MKPILKYRGGKLAEIPRFIQYVPRNFCTYIEPFVGGGALYFYLEHKPSIINDINTKLMTFYKQIKENFWEVKQQLWELQCEYERNQRNYEERKKLADPDERVEDLNEQLYYHMRSEFNYPTGKYLEAVTYYFINKTSYSGMIRLNKRGEYNVPFGRYKHFNTDLLTEKHWDLLKETEIFNTDYAEICAMATENDFVFLDPPYDTTFHDYGNGDEGFGLAEHLRLAEVFSNLNCYALMIIGKTELTAELYQDYIVDEYHKTYAVNIRNRFKNKAVHLVIANYDPAQVAVGNTVTNLIQT